MARFPHGPAPAVAFFNYVERASTTFASMTKFVSSRTQVEYHFSQVETSYWDRATGHVVISTKNAGHLVESDIIFEFCNAYNSVKYSEPVAHEFPGRLEYYGAVKEKFEWKSVKLHVTILTEVQKFDPHNSFRDWPLINRFAPAFDRSAGSWAHFQNYYQEQRLSGHTRKITSHHPSHVYQPTTTLQLPAGAGEPPTKKRRTA